jgi:probable rRNA maturation factor
MTSDKASSCSSLVAVFMMVEVVNRQRRRLMDCERWRNFAEKVLEKIGVSNEGATIAFVSDRVMRDLNCRFRGRDSTTDVLSFPSEQDEFEKVAEAATLGDVVVSVARAEAQSAEHGLEFEEEVAQLILHGLLHLRGYDHETDNGEMNRLELRLRRRLGI